MSIEPRPAPRPPTEVASVSGARAASAAPLRIALGLGLLLAVAWIPGLSDIALFDPDEGRNGSIAREMADRGEWLFPRLNGLPFLDKPFLSFALQAASIRLLGPTELATRLPSVLAIAAVVLLCARFAWRHGGPDAAWTTALAAGTAPLTLAFCRIATFDPLLTLWTTIALLAFLRTLDAGGAGGDDGEGVGAGSSRPAPTVRAPRGRHWARVAWVAMALGVLTKGPVALVVPLLVALAFAALRARRGPARLLVDPVGVALFFGLVAPWLGFMESRAPGFLRYALIEETWTRATTDAFRRSDHPLYFVPVLAVGTFPWALLALPAFASLRATLSAGWRKAGERLGVAGFLWLWVLVPLALFSWSQSKRPQYALPLVPAVALLAGLSTANGHAAGDRAAARRARRLAAGFWALLGGALLTLASRLAELLRHGPYDPAEVRGFAWRFGVVCVVAGGLAWWWAARPRAGAAALALPLVLLPLAGLDLLRATAEARSARALAAALQPRLRPSTLLVGVDTFAPSLPFYLGRPVVQSAPTAQSLTSNSILRFEAELRASHDDLLETGDWWRTVIERPWRPAILLVRSSHPTELAVLRQAGLERFFADERVEAFAYRPRGARRRGASGRPIAPATPPGGPAPDQPDRASASADPNQP